MKYFHVYADHKTVKEISQREYWKVYGRKNWLLGWIDDERLLFCKDGGSVLLTLEQLRKVLELNKKEA